MAGVFFKFSGKNSWKNVMRKFCSGKITKYHQTLPGAEAPAAVAPPVAIATNYLFS